MNARRKSINDICYETGLNQRTVRRWLKRWRNENLIDSYIRPGRALQLNHLDQVKLIAFALRNPLATLREMKVSLGFACSIRTINDYLQRNKLNTFDAPKKPSHFPTHL